VRDSDFKALNHNCQGYKPYLRGGELAPGYKPDYVLRAGTDFVILESEKASSRKHFLGGLLKAAHFLREERVGKLIFLLTPRDNTTVEQIARHLSPYLAYLAEISNLRDVFVVKAGDYCCQGGPLAIAGLEFEQCATKVAFPRER